jgi:hypothetical protein
MKNYQRNCRVFLSEIPSNLLSFFSSIKKWMYSSRVKILYALLWSWFIGSVRAFILHALLVDLFYRISLFPAWSCRYLLLVDPISEGWCCIALQRIPRPVLKPFADRSHHSIEPARILKNLSCQPIRWELKGTSDSPLPLKYLLIGSGVRKSTILSHALSPHTRLLNHRYLTLQVFSKAFKPRRCQIAIATAIIFASRRPSDTDGRKSIWTKPKRRPSQWKDRERFYTAYVVI